MRSQDIPWRARARVLVSWLVMAGLSVVTLVAPLPFSGQVTLLDIGQLAEPRLLARFTVSGNPDCAFIGEDSVLVPAGYQGLFRIVR